VLRVITLAARHVLHEAGRLHLFFHRPHDLRAGRPFVVPVAARRRWDVGGDDLRAIRALLLRVHLYDKVAF